MKSTVCITITTVLLATSCSHKVYPVTIVTDSVRVEYRDRLVKVTDSVVVEIPKIVESVITKDTISRLQNDYAISEAIISDGLLHHSLATIPQAIIKEVEVEVLVHDTIEVSNNTKFLPVEVEKVKYPKSYWLMLGIILLAIMYEVLRLFGKI